MVFNFKIMNIVIHSSSYKRENERDRGSLIFYKDKRGNY